jgi:hypothetical protein
VSALKVSSAGQKVTQKNELHPSKTAGHDFTTECVCFIFHGLFGRIEGLDAILATPAYSLGCNVKTTSHPL